MILRNHPFDVKYSVDPCIIISSFIKKTYVFSLSQCCAKFPKQYKLNRVQINIAPITDYKNIGKTLALPS